MIIINHRHRGDNLLSVLRITFLIAWTKPYLPILLPIETCILLSYFCKTVFMCIYLIENLTSRVNSIQKIWLHSTFANNDEYNGSLMIYLGMAVISLFMKLSKIIVYSLNLAVVLLLSIKSLNRGQKFTYSSGLCDPELDPGVTRNLSM